MPNPVQICELVLRDGHQSLLATRMRTDDMLPIAAQLDRWASGRWRCGAARPSTRPCASWTRTPGSGCASLKAAMPHTPFMMLLRGQNVVGYRTTPTTWWSASSSRARANGIDIFRIFDALNDVRNMQLGHGGRQARGSPRPGRHLLHQRPPYSTGILRRAWRANWPDMGADSHLHQGHGRAADSPTRPTSWSGGSSRKLALPIHLHSHSTSGMASAVHLKAVEAGVDIVDTAISLAGADHLAAADRVGRSPSLAGHASAIRGLDLDLLAEIAAYFADVRRKYVRFESGLVGVDVNVLQYQIPGGMLSNLVSQLREQNAEDKYEDVLAEVPRVRAELGYPAAGHALQPDRRHPGHAQRRAGRALQGQCPRRCASTSAATTAARRPRSTPR